MLLCSARSNCCCVVLVPIVVVVLVTIVVVLVTIVVVLVAIVVVVLIAIFITESCHLRCVIVIEAGCGFLGMRLHEVVVIAGWG